MRISSFKVRGYRTIRDEVEFPLRDRLTIVGPNNCGKTNSLKAVHQFFSGYENSLGYLFERDICQGQKSIKTNIQMVVSEINAVDDAEIYQNVEKVREQLGISTGDASEITFYLTFSNNSNPSYRVFPTAKRPKGGDAATYSRAEKALFQSIFNKISVHYIPSEKSIPQLYETLVEPYLKVAIHNALESHLNSARQALSEISDSIGQRLGSIGLNGFSLKFELPDDAQEVLGSVRFSVEDPTSTPIFSKGMGIQSISLLSALCWISEKEAASGKHVLWLIEEPESYLHPELLRQSDQLIGKLTETSQVILTTHSLGFVPAEPSRVLGLELDKGWTKGKRFDTYNEATSHIRNSLGVRFSDFYNLSSMNIFVEGKTDRGYLDHVIDIFREEFPEDPDLQHVLSKNTTIHDFDGVKGLEGFLRATYSFISNEVASVALLDGDDAGDRCRRSLVAYFGNKGIQYRANQEYVVVRDRFSIEALIGEELLREVYADHQSWFVDFSEDAEGNLLPFEVHDNRKTNLLNWFVNRASKDDVGIWCKPWLVLLKAINAALETQQ